MADNTSYEVPNVTPIPQPTSKTCWLACYQMLFKFARQPLPDIDSKLTTAFGATVYDSIVNETGLLDEHLMRAAGALGFPGMPKSVLADFDKFTNYLRLSGPLMCTGTFSLRTFLPIGESTSILDVGCFVCLADTSIPRCLKSY